MSKRKREGEKATKKSINLAFAGRTSKLTWFEGTSGEEIEQHIRKKLQIAPSAGEVFLLDPDSKDDDDLVISASLPANTTFNVKVYQHASPRCLTLSLISRS